jgi:hypothetical protein
VHVHVHEAGKEPHAVGSYDACSFWNRRRGGSHSHEAAAINENDGVSDGLIAVQIDYRGTHDRKRRNGVLCCNTSQWRDEKGREGKHSS